MQRIPKLKKMIAVHPLATRDESKAEGGRPLIERGLGNWDGKEGGWKVSA